jgi:diguanylate cyclase (GGDEF)-like protein
VLPQGWTGIGPAQLQGIGYLAFYLAMLVGSAGYLLLAREALQGELARLEMVDALTDVPNRRGFYGALAPWLALARRPGTPTALLILNLDGFKRVNDHYGHGVGDQVLQAMVAACRRQLRDSDLMGRLGGAEFAIQLPRTTLADAVVVAERIRASIEADPVKAERAVIALTASVGVTTIRADDSTVSLFNRADEALQAAKLRGRNQVVAAPLPLPEESTAT